MVSLDTLNTLVFDLVCSELRSDPFSHLTCPLKALCLVNRRMYQAVLPYLFRHITLQITGNDTSKSAMFIQHMLDQDSLRNLVREITLMIAQENFTEQTRYNYAQHAFKRLLPKLSGLNHVSLESSVWPYAVTVQDMRSLHPSVLEMIHDLEPTPTLDVQTYTQSLDFESLLQVTCLSSLKINLLDASCRLHHDDRQRFIYDGHASIDISRVITYNKGLRHLNIQLQGTRRDKPAVYDYERDHALENIGAVVSRLKSLIIGGNLRCTSLAVQTWTATLNWAELELLDIDNITVIEELLPKLDRPLPRLKVMKLSTIGKSNAGRHAYDYDYRTRAALPQPVEFKDFFSCAPNLERLSLDGFPLGFVDILKDNKALRYLHVTMDKIDRLDSQDAQKKFQLRNLQQAAPDLEWLALDVPHSVLRSVRTRHYRENLSDNNPASTGDTPSLMSRGRDENSNRISPYIVDNLSFDDFSLLEEFPRQMTEENIRRLRSLSQSRVRRLAQQIANRVSQERLERQIIYEDQLAHGSAADRRTLSLLYESVEPLELVNRDSLISTIREMKRLRHFRLRLISFSENQTVEASLLERRDSALRFFKDISSGKKGSTLQSIQLEDVFISRLDLERVLVRHEKCQAISRDAHAPEPHITYGPEPEKNDGVYFEEWNINKLTLIKDMSFNLDFIENGPMSFTNSRKMPQGWDDDA